MPTEMYFCGTENQSNKILNSIVKPLQLNSRLITRQQTQEQNWNTQGMYKEGSIIVLCPENKENLEAILSQEKRLDGTIRKNITHICNKT